MQMPNSIPVDELRQTNPCYDAEKIRRHAALYEGGSAFRAQVEKMLVKRQLEEQSTQLFNGAALFRERTKRAWYVNRAGGFVDYACAKVLGDSPRIVVGEGVPDDVRSYWEGMNDDADGLGTSLLEIARELLKDAFVHGRAYLDADYASKQSVPGDPATSKAVMRVIPMSSVEDWDVAADGSLGWVKRHTVGIVRNPAKQWMSEQSSEHFWTFFQPEEIVVYKAISETRAAPTEGNALVFSRTEHMFGMPVFDLRLPKGFHLLDRIEDVALALYNAECDKASLMSASAFQVPTLTGVNRTVGELQLSEWGALVLRDQENFKFTSPDTGVYDAMFKNIDSLRQSLFEVVQAMARDASTLPQAGRLSGAAVAEMRDPMQVLLMTFASPVRDCLTRWIRAVQKHRGESKHDVSLEGLGRVDASMSEVRGILQADGGQNGAADAAADGSAAAPMAEPLNGAQVTAAAEIVSQVAAGTLPRESGVAMLKAFFLLDTATAEAVIGSAGTDRFKPAVSAPTTVRAVAPVAEEE